MRYGAFRVGKQEFPDTIIVSALQHALLRAAAKTDDANI